MLEDLKNILNLPTWRQVEAIKLLIAKLEALPKEEKQRTLKQNSALHAGFNLIAQRLTESGKDMRTVLKPSVDIYWTGFTVKEYLYKPILKLLTKKESTAEMDKNEPSESWDIMMKFLGENHEMEYIPFPSKTVIDEKNDAIAMATKIDYPTEESEEITAF